MHVGMPWLWQRANALAMLTCLLEANIPWPTWIALAFATFLWRLRWPLFCALAVVAFPMGATLILALCVPLSWLLPREDCHGLGSMDISMSWPWKHLRVIQIRV